MAGEADSVILLALIFPPAAVAFLAGCGADFCLNFLLTLLGWFPGCIHAFWLILKRSEANETYGYGNWTYAGMGEYFPRTQGQPSTQTSAASRGVPPPPSSTGPVPPPGQGPIQEKGGNAAPPPAPAESKPGSDQEKSALPPPTDQKDGGEKASVPPLAPADQKQADPAVQSTAPPSGV